MSSPFTRKVASLLLVAGLVITSVAPSQAGDCGCHFEKTVTYVCVQVPYRICLTRYDHCGRPYHIYVTKFRTVEQPVVKWVKVCP